MAPTLLGGPVSPAGVLALQRAVGNAAVGALLGRSGVAGIHRVPAVGAPRARKRGLGEPLDATEAAAVDDSLAREHDTEARERRIVQTVELIARMRGLAAAESRLPVEILDVMREPEPEAYFSQYLPRLMWAQGLLEEVMERDRLFTGRLEAEFNSFGDEVRGAFAANAQTNGAKKGDGLASYRYIRARLWRLGWLDPPTIFRQIVPAGKVAESATLLGAPIQWGAHALLLETLGELAAPQGHAPPVRDVIGFQPRRIAGSEALSNHVFGLAIDIDPTSNPHVVSKRVREIFTQHSGLDFMQPLVIPKGKDASETMFRNLSGASERFRRWLATALPIERKLVAAHKDAILKLAIAEGALDRTMDADMRSAAEAQHEAAKRELAAAEFAVSNSAEAWEVGQLREQWGGAVDKWQATGIISLPFGVVQSLKALSKDDPSLQLRWGAEYEKSKDTMHFELLPDAPKVKARLGGKREGNELDYNLSDLEPAAR